MTDTQFFVAVDNTATLGCRVTAVPAPSLIQITFIRDDNRTVVAELAVESTSQDMSQQVYMLDTMVTPTSLEETGDVYECVAVSSQGNGTDSISLVVQGELLLGGWWGRPSGIVGCVISPSRTEQTGVPTWGDTYGYPSHGFSC